MRFVIFELLPCKFFMSIWLGNFYLGPFWEVLGNFG